MTTADTQRQFAVLLIEKLALKERLDAVERELAALQEPLLNYFADAGQSSVKMGGITLYIHQQLWANTKEGSTAEQACAAMQACDMSAFVAPRFNVMTLSAYVRELSGKGETLPEPVLEHIAVTNKVEIRGRRS